MMFFRVLLVLWLAGSALAGEWTEPVHAGRGGKSLVSFRAKLDADLLVVEVYATEGWHTYAMDNKRRATEALGGKMSLGVEENTAVAVSNGLEVVGPWRQSEPKDFSQPKLRWYSYGFDGRALLAAPVKKNGPGPATIALDGQVCDSVSCQNVKAELTLQFDVVGEKTELDLASLVEVRH